MMNYSDVDFGAIDARVTGGCGGRDAAFRR
jgi:hypothetical protein